MQAFLGSPSTVQTAGEARHPWSQCGKKALRGLIGGCENEACVVGGISGVGDARTMRHLPRGVYTRSRGTPGRISEGGEPLAPFDLGHGAAAFGVCPAGFVTLWLSISSLYSDSSLWG